MDDSRRGAAFGGILAAFDTGIGTGSVAAGWIVEHYGFRTAYGARPPWPRWPCPSSAVDGAGCAAERPRAGQS